MTLDPRRHTAFAGHRLLESGDLQDVALAVHRALSADRDASLLVFCDATGAQTDLDLRGTEADVASRYARPQAVPSGEAPSQEPAEPTPRGRGRPRLGVVAREVTLLPDHWDWLAAQPGGISVTLRKLVHQARRAWAARTAEAKAKERAYAFMSAIAGDLPAFEEAARALFAGDRPELVAATAGWPEDVRTHLLRLSQPEPGDAAPPPG